jgi:hypothetical protein
MKEFTLHLPVIDKNKVLFSWDPCEGFKSTSYFVEFPDVSELKSSAGKLTEAYFPLCLLLASKGEVTIHLPVRLPDQIISEWKKVILKVSEKLYRNPACVTFMMSSVEPDYNAQANSANKMVLFFGGGTESLLTLARLIEKNVKPYLASLGGPNWPGSDPEINPDKFKMDARVSQELDLPLIRVRTNFKDIFYTSYWKKYLKDGVSLLNAVLAMPSFISFLLPITEAMGIGQLVNGNEKMNFPDEYFCFSPPVTDLLENISKNVRYESHLGDLLKEDVCRELYGKYPQFVQYQYSCWRNRNKRWCYRCQSCLEYYMLLKDSGLDPAVAGMNEGDISSNMDRLIWAVAKSDEARPGEIWERLCTYPNLRSDVYLRQVLDKISFKAVMYHRFLHHFYSAVPEEVTRSYWKTKSRLKSVLLRNQAS